MQDNTFLNWIFVTIVFGGAVFLLYRNAIKGRMLARTYRNALLDLRRNPNSPQARIEATRAGAAFYGSRNNDGKPSRFDQDLMTKEIQEATGGAPGQKQPTKANNNPVFRPPSEYRNIR